MSENQNQGWIKLHRRLLSNPVFKNPKLLQPFLYCLLKASHEDREQLIGDSIVPLKQGQLVTGRKAISEATGLTEQNIRTSLKKLETLGILTSKPTNKYSIISITNWDSYQQANQQVTSSQPTSNQQTNHKQEVKNYKNGKNENPMGDKSPPKQKRNIQLPKDFILTNHLEDLANNYWYSKNRIELCANEEFGKFTNHHKSKGSKMADWEAAWTTWYTNAVRFNNAPVQITPNQQSLKPMTQEEYEELNHEIAKRQR